MSRATFLPSADLIGSAVADPSALVLRRTSRVLQPRPILAGAALLSAALVVLELCDAGGLGQRHWRSEAVVTSAAAAAAMALLARRGGIQPLGYARLALALALATLGTLALELRPLLGHSPATLAATVSFVSGTLIAAAVVVPALYRRLDHRAAVSALLDGAIMWLAGLTVLLVAWQARLAGPGGPIELLPAALATTFLASAGLAAIAALAMRAEPAAHSVWCGIAGVTMMGCAWIAWVDRAFHGRGLEQPEAALYSAGVLVVAYGWLTWNDRVGYGRLYETLSRTLLDWLPIAALLVCVALDAMPRDRRGSFDAAPVGTAAVVLVAIARQRVLLVAERQASHRLTREVEERAATMLSLARLEPAATVSDTARRICAEALRLEDMDAAAVYAFGPGNTVIPLALAGSGWSPEAVGEPLDEERARHLRVAAVAGPWLDSAADSARAGRGVLRGEAFAPLHWDDRIVGVVAMGTLDAKSAARLPERLSTVAEFGVVSAAMLGPMLVEHWRREDLRAQLEQIILAHAFRPVFQPVMDLQSRVPVGFEALTRFGDGTRPDQRFLEADAVGMSARLETACLAEQLEAAAWLPQGAWVSLNVSPALAAAVVPLVAALERTERDVVIEITEHVEIADYRRLVEALDTVRGRARLAVDDAGAGYAGLRHILELRPQYVKLDISLVRSVDADPARQAMVAGMAHFARNAGCELIAEGIETPDELATLMRLGVGLGQGFLLGRPVALD